MPGPDLLRATLEPHRFLEFSGGHLERGFVKGRAELEKRLTEVDIEPDPDGRYRVTDLFCYRDTGQSAVEAPAKRSDAIVRVPRVDRRLERLVALLLGLAKGSSIASNRGRAIRSFEG